MKLYLIMDETSFYHPNFIARLIEQTKDEVVGAAIVKKISKKNNIADYLVRHWYYLKVREIFSLIIESIKAVTFDMFLPKKRGGNFYSVKSVFQFFKIDFIEVSYDINQEKYLTHIKSKSPDVIISSNSLYFGKNLLGIPKVCSINRHSALLPSYGGLFPVLQAYTHNEFLTGVSVHLMTLQIDKGNVIAQKAIAIDESDTIATLYQKCFKVSVDVILDALEKIRIGDFSKVSNTYVPSYYSFPTENDWKLFRKRKGRFI